LRRAAVSTASNIVEGCARHTESEYLRFLDIAFGSVQELEYQLSLARRLGFLKLTDGAAVSAIAAETSKVLSGLIRSLRKK
jgi:four helix bundle protein